MINEAHITGCTNQCVEREPSSFHWAAQCAARRLGVGSGGLPASCPPPSPCFPRLSSFLLSSLAWDSRQSPGTNCRPLSQVPGLSLLDTSKASVETLTLSFPDPQRQPSHLRPTEGMSGRFPSHASPPCCGLNSKTPSEPLKKQTPLQHLQV